VIPGLIGLYALRDHLEAAIAAIEPVLPALAAWETSRENAAEEPAPAPDRPPAQALSSPREPLSRPDGPSEAAPTPPVGGNGADLVASAVCERCGSEFDPGRGPGPRKRYCSRDCRKAAAADRARAREREPEVELDPEPLPDLAMTERPFAMVSYADDPRSDPDALRPPALAWQ
jgi:hypothetical protein